MATKTSLRVSLLVLLVVLYLDCSLQGAQASPIGNILPTWAEKVLDVPESHPWKKTVTVFKGNSTVVPGADKVEFEYAGLFPPLDAISSNTESDTYPANYIVDSISVYTEWYEYVGTVTLSCGGYGYNYWALTWGLPPFVRVHYRIIIIIIILR
jgi:hypothetical protein